MQRRGEDVSDTEIIVEMLEALRMEVRANTFAIRGNHRWNHKDTQPKLMRTMDVGNLHAEKARTMLNYIINGGPRPAP